MVTLAAACATPAFLYASADLTSDAPSDVPTAVGLAAVSAVASVVVVARIWVVERAAAFLAAAAGLALRAALMEGMDPSQRAVLAPVVMVAAAAVAALLAQWLLPTAACGKVPGQTAGCQQLEVGPAESQAEHEGSSHEGARRTETHPLDATAVVPTAGEKGEHLQAQNARVLAAE